MARSSRGNAQVGAPVRGKEAASRAPSGRVCEQEGCTTILSTYNRATHCSVHTEPAYRHALYQS
jgi:hypothetical protein